MGLPETIASVVIGGTVWCLSDDFQKARIKRGLCHNPAADAPTPEAPQAQTYTAPPAIAPIAAPIAEIKPYGERLGSLKSVLGSHGLTPFWELRNATPVRFCGWQRSGKSTKAQTLALLRQLDNPQHPVTVCTPHHPTPGDATWSPSFRVAGEGNQWAAIKSEIDRVMTRLGKGDTDSYTTILDEFSGYAGQGGMSDGYIQEVMLSAIREMAKHQEMLVLICHGDTMALNGNVKGLSAALWGNFVTVNCNRLLIDGKAQPSPEVSIYGGGFPNTKLVWPAWFNPQWLLRQFPELAAIRPLDVASAIPDLSHNPASPVPSPVAQTEDDLPDHIDAVLAYLNRKNEPVSIRQIQQAKLPELVNTDNNKSATIQLVLDSLVYAGKISPTAIGEYAAVGVGG